MEADTPLGLINQRSIMVPGGFSGGTSYHLLVKSALRNGGSGGRAFMIALPPSSGGRDQISAPHIQGICSGTHNGRLRRDTIRDGAGSLERGNVKRSTRGSHCRKC